MRSDAAVNPTTSQKSTDTIFRSVTLPTSRFNRALQKPQNRTLRRVYDPSRSPSMRPEGRDSLRCPYIPIAW